MKATTTKIKRQPNYNNYNFIKMMSDSCQQLSLSDVNEFLSNFSLNLSNGVCMEASSNILSDIGCILSEIHTIVKLVGYDNFSNQLQHQQQEQQEFWWDESNDFDVYQDSNDQSSVFSFSECEIGSIPDTQSISSESGLSSSSSSVSTDSNTVSTIGYADDEMQLLEDEIFIDTILDLCDTIAPNSVFSVKRSKRRRHRKMRRKVHHELRSIWSHSSAIVTPVEAVPIIEPRYPFVDWSKVNKRFVDNVPPPIMIPVQGCSQVPDVSKSPEYINTKYPYGSKAGYKTNLGVIPVPSELVAHGHVWVNGEGWVLHAQYIQERSERQPKERTPFSRPRGRSKREPRQPATPCHA